MCVHVSTIIVMGKLLQSCLLDVMIQLPAYCSMQYCPLKDCVCVHACSQLIIIIMWPRPAILGISLIFYSMMYTNYL